MEGIDDPCEYDRKIVSFQDLGRFKLTERKYNDDSLNIYTARLNDLREDTLRRAKLKWSKPPVCTSRIFPFSIIYVILFYVCFSRPSTCRGFTPDPGKPKKVLYFGRSALQGSEAETFLATRPQQGAAAGSSAE